VPGFDTGGSPEELVVFLHGWDASPETAKQFTEETTNALRANGYEHPVVGYSWDAEGSLLEWWGVTEIAEENGTKLASFLTDFRATNRDTTIRLVPYSLGARVALTACETLLDQRRMNLVTTMSLLGAAVDDTAIVEQSGYLRGITQITGQTDNFHNVDDPVLTGRYEFAEASSALGAVGANQGKPRNYDDHDVSYVDGHEEYFLEDLGVIPAVLKTW
jgi:pimeloyl-ACP methyl ester carboxylesterase